MTEPLIDSGDHLDDDALIDMCGDLVSAEDREAWVDHIERCPRCETRLRRAARLAAGTLPKRPASAESRRRPHSRTLLAAVVAAVAVVALIAITVLQFDGRDAQPNTVAALYVIPLDAELVQIRADAEPSSLAEFIEGLRHYQEGNWQAAYRSFNAADVPSDYEGLLTILTASSLNHLGEFEESLEGLETLPMELLPQPWRGRAQRLRHEALVGCGRPEEAAVLAGEMVDNN